MLRASLCLLGGLGLDAERRLWRQGIVTWNDYAQAGRMLFSEPRHQRILADLPVAEEALSRNDVRFFLRRLPRAARMRIWPLIHNRAVYLDIETTGLNDDDPPTTAVLFDGRHLHAFIAGQNLQHLPALIPRESVLVTYNGRRFDLPRLRRFLGCRLPHPHLDLAPVLRAAGYGPGLKACERQLQVPRRTAQDLTGADAVVLWQRHQTGDPNALQQLLVYNMQDTLALQRVLIAAYNASMAECPGFRAISLPRQPRGVSIDMEARTRTMRQHGSRLQ